MLNHHFLHLSVGPSSTYLSCHPKFYFFHHVSVWILIHVSTLIHEQFSASNFKWLILCSLKALIWVLLLKFYYYYNTIIRIIVLFYLYSNPWFFQPIHPSFHLSVNDLFIHQLPLCHLICWVIYPWFTHPSSIHLYPHHPSHFVFF